MKQKMENKSLDDSLSDFQEHRIQPKWKVLAELTLINEKLGHVKTVLEKETVFFLTQICKVFQSDFSVYQK